MIIPEGLLSKSNKDSLKVRSRIIIDEGWRYLNFFFKTEVDYFNFLESITKEKFNAFLYTMFFYYTHDLYRLPPESRMINIDGFMYQITLSVMEYLQKIEGSPWKRIHSFSHFFSPQSTCILNSMITGHIKDKPNFKLNFLEILYDMRNKFIHEAGWFSLIEENSNAFASIVFLKHRNKDGSFTEYTGDIRIKFNDYSRLFWEAYLNYLNPY